MNAPRGAGRRRDADGYAYARCVELPFALAVEAVERSIRSGGFRVTHVHDVDRALAAKGFPINPFRIYELDRVRPRGGAGSDDLGQDKAELLMPVKLYVYQEDETVVVAALRPTLMCSLFPDEGLEQAANGVERRVVGVVNEATSLLPEATR